MDFTGAAEPRHCPGHSEAITAIAISPDGQSLAVGGCKTVEPLGSCTLGGLLRLPRAFLQSWRILRRWRQLLQEGLSLIIFPEGTRSPDGRMGELKKGGFMMALEMGLPILPVSISGTRHILPSHALRLLPGRVDITVHEPIDVSGYSVERREHLMRDVAAAIRSGLSPWEQGERRAGG